MSIRGGLRVLLPDDLVRLPRRTYKPGFPTPAWVDAIGKALRADPKEAKIFEFTDERLVAALSSNWSVTMLYPDGFKQLRKRSGFADDDAFVRSLETAQPFRVFAGRSGAEFSRTCDGKLVVKQVPDGDFKAIAHIGRRYLHHVTGETCMAKILGAFKVHIKPNIYNVVVSQAIAAPPAAQIIGQFDLKGLVRSVKPGTPGFEFSDAGFNEPLVLEKRSHERFFRILKNDLDFLQGQGLVDYSLLVCHTNQGLLVVGLINYLGFFGPATTGSGCSKTSPSSSSTTSGKR